MRDYQGKFDDTDAIGKTLLQAIAVVIVLVIAYFVIDFLGFGDWVRKNSIWFMMFALAVMALFLTNLAKEILEQIKNDSSSNEHPVLKRLEELDLDIDRIKNTVKVLKDNLVGPGHWE
jgi:hypothetical protein